MGQPCHACHSLYELCIGPSQANYTDTCHKKWALTFLLPMPKISSQTASMSSNLITFFLILQ